MIILKNVQCVVLTLILGYEHVYRWNTETEIDVPNLLEIVGKIYQM